METRASLAQKLMPGSDPHWSAMLVAQHITLRPAAAGLATTGHTYEKPLLVLMVLVALVLLISCGNVANLILARNSARQHEISIRVALGAGRARIVSQLFAESLLLSVAGAALGLLLAMWGTRLLLSFLPQPEVPLAFDLKPGFAVLGFTAVVAFATAVMIALAPAWRAGRVGAELSLRTAQRVTRSSFSGSVLVAGQLAVSLLLLIGAGLFVSTLHNLSAADLGFRPDDVVTFDLSFPKGTTEDHLRPTYEQMKRRLESHPGILVAAYAWPGVW
jgi:predicted lysophospholipase L1 biosynthesis ABC-type transport system permease subunit